MAVCPFRICPLPAVFLPSSELDDCGGPARTSGLFLLRNRTSWVSQASLVCGSRLCPRHDPRPSCVREAWRSSFLFNDTLGSIDGWEPRPGASLAFWSHTEDPRAWPESARSPVCIYYWGCGAPASRRPPQRPNPLSSRFGRSGRALRGDMLSLWSRVYATAAHPSRVWLRSVPCGISAPCPGMCVLAREDFCHRRNLCFAEYFGGL